VQSKDISNIPLVKALVLQAINIKNSSAGQVCSEDLQSVTFFWSLSCSFVWLYNNRVVQFLQKNILEFESKDFGSFISQMHSKTWITELFSNRRLPPSSPKITFADYNKTLFTWTLF
jgi:hypothetical protein